MAASVVLNVGDKFSSFDELNEAIKRFECEQKVTFWKRHSRTLVAAPKHGVKIPQNDAIKYYELKYACINGGKKHKSASSGKRPNQSTFRCGCNAFVAVKASKDAQHLVITALSSEHNHQASDETFQFLPKRRRLNEDERAEVATILKTRPNKKILQNHIQTSTGKKITLRDIKNLEKKLKGPVKDLEEILQGISSRPGSIVEVVTDDTNMLRGIYYQDETMQKKFSNYPELLIADATYKLNVLRMPVFLQIVVDGNGESEIVSVFIIVSEDNDTLKCLIEMFQQHNEAWTRTKTVLTDKDMLERSVYKELMPAVDLQLCLFHVLKTIKREVHCEKFGIRIEEKNLCLEIVQDMAYSQNEEEYEKNLQRLRDTNIISVVDYIQHSWHDIRDQWVIGLKHSCHYGNNTTNRIESINQKLKQVIARFSNLGTFFSDLELIIGCLRQERDSRVSNILLKTPVCTLPNGSPERQYMQLLTPMAYKVVLNQISLSSKVRLPILEDDNGPTVQLTSVYGPIEVSSETCTCKFVLFNNLPCRHIFAVRAKRMLHLYTESCVADRWRMDFYARNSLAALNTNTDDYNDGQTSEAIPITTLRPRTVLSQHQKYKVAYALCQRLATLTSEGAMTKHDQRMKTLRDLVQFWEQDAEVVVVRIDEDVEVLRNNFQVSDEDRDIGNSSHPVPEVITSATLTDEDETRNVEPLPPKNVKKIHRPELLSTAPRIPVLKVSMRPSSTQTKTTEAPVVQPAASSEAPIDLDPSSIDNRVLTEITLPTKMNLKGRPKGAEQTVIGLPRRKIGTKTTAKKSRPVPFSKKLPLEKDRYVLRWFVSGSAAEAATAGKLLEKEDLKKLQEISHACRDDDSAVVHRARKYFSEAAWKAVANILCRLKKIGWLCTLCKRDLDSEQLGCDGCLEWYHLSCTGLKKAPKSKKWYCKKCYCQC